MSGARYARQQDTLYVSLNTVRATYFAAQVLRSTAVAQYLVDVFCPPQPPFLSPHANIGLFDGCLSVNRVRQECCSAIYYLTVCGWPYCGYGGP